MTAAVTLVLVMLPTVAVQAVHVPETLSHRAPVTAGPVTPGFPIDHLGVLWDDPGHAPDHADHSSHGAVRFRLDGVWGEWIPLIKDGAPGEGLWASGLVAGGGAEAFQVRGIPPGAGSPRTAAFNTSDGPLRTSGIRVGGAAAIDNCVSRAEWGADESLRSREAPDFFDAQVMTVHHTATSNDDPDPEGTVRAIYAYHSVDNGWRDIGYNYLIGEDGRVFEGRWSGQLGANPEDDTYSQACNAGGNGADFAHESTDPDAQVARGAHVGGFNTGNIGVALLGSFNTDGPYQGDPTTPAVSAAEQLLAELAARHDIDPLGTVDYVNDVNSLSVDAIAGHRDYLATECPGDVLYAMLPAIRENVAALLVPVDDAPPQVSVASPADGATVHGTVAVTASATDDVAVERVAFSVDGLPIGVDDDGSDGWSVSWESMSTTDGAHTITATATDTAGQSADAAVIVTVANQTTPGPSTMHVADLDGVSTSQGRTWTAAVTASVRENTGSPVAGATVNGMWNDDSTTSCRTDTSGTCSAELAGIRKRTGVAQFTVVSVWHDDLTYDAAGNTDTDGDSDGTTITVRKP